MTSSAQCAIVVLSLLLAAPSPAQDKGTGSHKGSEHRITTDYTRHKKAIMPDPNQKKGARSAALMGDGSVHFDKTQGSSTPDVKTAPKVKSGTGKPRGTALAGKRQH